MGNVTLFALSGFLGLPADWSFLNFKGPFHAVDWQRFPLESLHKWGTAFNNWVKEQGSGPNVLMGYSLGGRLALHALMDCPSLWQGAVIISTHPGLHSAEMRLKRLQSDQKWARRFIENDWEKVMASWNRQEVFASGSFHFERRESDYNRPFLADALTRGSLGMQEDLRPQIGGAQIPICWITGSLDIAYSRLAEELFLQHPLSRIERIEGAGHRAPWEQPDSFLKIVNDFVMCI